MNNKTNNHIHFVGIGGSSMSGLAELAIKQGYFVSGSDRSISEKAEVLRRKGAIVYEGHDAKNITDDITLVVYTLAVPLSNPELEEARKRNIPIIERGEYLGQICSHYKYSVAVAGTHGKTSTTSMLSSIFISAKKEPSIHIGGFFPLIKSNVLASNSDFFITEACEYHENFLHLHPFGEIILNIEAEHLDYYRDLNHVMDAFSKFVSFGDKNGFIVVCADDENAMNVIKNSNSSIITYSIKDKNADVYAENITNSSHGSNYMLYYKQKPVTDICLNVPGLHNVSNSLAAAAAALFFSCSPESIKNGLEAFCGTGRRFEQKGEYKGAPLIDDYAHHPTEIKATLSAAKDIISKNGKIYAILQPHTYSRALAFQDEFATALKDADTVIVSDIFAAREKDPGTISGLSMAEYFKSKGINALHISDFADIAKYIKEHAGENDIVITLGAGNINEVIGLVLK